MAKFDEDFDARNVDPQEDRQVLPNGHYQAIIEKSDWQDTKKQGGKMLVLELQIIDGKHKGRKIWDRLNLVNQNEVAVDIAKSSLSSICHATGVMQLGDSDELHNIPFIIRVACERRKDNGELANVIKAYKSAKEGGELLDDDGNDKAPPPPTPDGGSAVSKPGAAPWKDRK